VRWVPVKNIHLTLVFLGDVSRPTWKPQGYAALRDRWLPAFELAVGRMGAFPRSASRAWSGWGWTPARLPSLQHRIAQGTAALGYPVEDRPFSPHLTLGRVGKTASPEQVLKIGEILAAQTIETLETMRVASLNLYAANCNPAVPFTPVCIRYPCLPDPKKDGQRNPFPARKRGSQSKQRFSN